MNFLSSRLSIDLRSLAAFRIGAAGVLLLDVCRRLSDLSAHYSDSGILPRSLRLSELEALSLPGQWSLYFLNGSAGFAGFLLVASAAAAILLALGWRTRIVIVVCWVLYASLIARNPYIKDGGHNLLRLFLFWGMFLPLGARWSLDARRDSSKFGDKTHAWSGATIAILFQIALVYWMSAIWKASSVWRSSEDALAQALTIESLATDLAPIALQFPFLLQIGTRIALVVEEIGPLAALALPVLSSWRTVAVASMIGLHAAIAILFALGIFPLIAACGWLIFLPTPFWDRIEGFFTRRAIPPLESLRLLRGNRIAGGFALFCLAYIFLWNIAALPAPHLANLMPDWARHFGRVTYTGQRWSFFAPEILTRDGWYVSDATLKDGTRIDLCRTTPAGISFEKPPNIRESYRNKPWRQYLSHVFHLRRAHLADGYASWLRREWDRDHPENPVTSLNLYFMLQNSKYPEDGVKKVRVYPCEEIDENGRGIYEGDSRVNERLRRLESSRPDDLPEKEGTGYSERDE